MDSKQIGQLLEKYWNCETSLEEEQQLKDFFNGGNVPEALKETAELFRFFQLEKGRGLDDKFDATVTKEIRRRPAKGKLVSMLSTKYVMRIAAGLIVVVAATFLVRQEIRKSYPAEVADTYSDPKLALEETKKALLLISRSFGKAKQEAGKMNVFNEAEKKIQGKESKEEKDKINI